MKLRADSTLSKLNQDQLDQLFDWLSDESYEDVIEQASQPAPVGFGLKLHKTTLVRFFRDETRRRHAEELSHLAASSMDVSDTQSSVHSPRNSGITDLIAAARGEFAHAIYELSLATDEPENFDRLERALYHVDAVTIRQGHLALKEREAALDQQRFDFQKTQWQFDAAHLALKQAETFKEIIKDRDLDEYEKIWAARELCFGPLPPHLRCLPAKPDTLGHDNENSSAFTCASSAPAEVRSLQNGNEFTVQNSQLTTETPDTLGHTNTEKLSPRHSVLKTTAPRPDTVGQTKPQPSLVGASNSPLNPQSPALDTPANPIPDTLGHINTEKLSHQSSVLEPAATPDTLGHTEPSSAPFVPNLTPRKMRFSEWLDKSIEPDSVRTFIRQKVCGGHPVHFANLEKVNDFVWIEAPHILRLVA